MRGYSPALALSPDTHGTSRLCQKGQTYQEAVKKHLLARPMWARFRIGVNPTVLLSLQARPLERHAPSAHLPSTYCTGKVAWGEVTPPMLMVIGTALPGVTAVGTVKLT